MNFVNIKINDTEITAHSDGSITRPRYKGTDHTFGYKMPVGYMSIYINSRKYQVHRIIAQAFLSDFSEYPQVDHIDGDGTNNDVSNLRMVTSGGNLRAHQKKRDDCSSQYRGVSWDKRVGRWLAQCTVDRKKKHLGFFDDERDAAMARDNYAFSRGFAAEGLNLPNLFNVN